jgi:hypothetical protein
LFDSREDYARVEQELAEEQGGKEVTAFNPKTGQRLKLDRANNRWIDFETGVPV